MASEQKYKENDSLNMSFESSNRRELLFFTDRQQVYKAKVADFADTKASVLGVFLPTALEMDEGENVLMMLDPGDYQVRAAARVPERQGRAHPHGGV